jgi:hypothetical protein
MPGGRKVKSQVEVILASAARAASAQSIGSGLAAQFDDVIFVCDVTAISGVAAALELVYQISLDAGTTWVDLGAIGTPMTATGTMAARMTAPIGHFFRVDARITGTTPSVTFSLLADFGIRG